MKLEFVIPIYVSSLRQEFMFYLNTVQILLGMDANIENLVIEAETVNNKLIS